MGGASVWIGEAEEDCVVNGDDDHREEGRECEAAHHRDRHRRVEWVGYERDHAENGCRGGQTEGPQTRDAGAHDGIDRGVTRGQTGVDFVDDDDGVLNLHADEGEQAQERHEAERLVEGEKPADDAHKDERHGQEDDEGLAEGVEEEDGNHEHDGDNARHFPKETLVGVTGSFLFATPFGSVAGGKRLGEFFNVRTEAAEGGVGVVAESGVGLDGEAKETVAAMDDGVLGDSLESGEDLHQRNGLGEGARAEPRRQEGVGILTFGFRGTEADVERFVAFKPGADGDAVGGALDGLRDFLAGDAEGAKTGRRDDGPDQVSAVAPIGLDFDEVAIRPEDFKRLLAKATEDVRVGTEDAKLDLLGIAGAENEALAGNHDIGELLGDEFIDLGGDFGDTLVVVEVNEEETVGVIVVFGSSAHRPRSTSSSKIIISARSRCAC